MPQVASGDDRDRVALALVFADQHGAGLETAGTICARPAVPRWAHRSRTSRLVSRHRSRRWAMRWAPAPQATRRSPLPPIAFRLDASLTLVAADKAACHVTGATVAHWPLCSRTWALACNSLVLNSLLLDDAGPALVGHGCEVAEPAPGHLRHDRCAGPALVTAHVSRRTRLVGAPRACAVTAAGSTSRRSRHRRWVRATRLRRALRRGGSCGRARSGGSCGRARSEPGAIAVRA